MGLTIQSIQAWIQSTERDLFQLFQARILLGFTTGLQARDLREDVQNTTAGFSFVDLARASNSKLGTSEAMLRYLEQFLDQLAMVVQLTWGMPTREPELLGLCWKNSRTKQRNLYIVKDRVMFATTDPKTEGRTESVEQNMHFLPVRLSNVVVQYLLYIRPFVVMLPRLAAGGKGP
ncbi:hypothetical protein BJX64DRAFT_295606 [Aspergillus heterothallicus]